jgi:hypothetical protein
MKLIGKFYSYSFIYNELKMPFHLNEGVEEILGGLSHYLDEPLIFNFNDDIIVKGVIDSFTGKKDKLTISLLSKIEDQSSIAPIALLANKDPVYVMVDVDENAERPLKRVHSTFLSKIQVMLNEMARQVGNTSDEMFKLLAYTGQFNKLRLSTYMYQVDAEMFHNYMVDFALNKGIPLRAERQEKNIEIYLKHCREKNRCVACGAPSEIEKGLYPVCRKHKKEFIDIGRDKFEGKYKLRS